jgi:hypothetical protein
MDYARPVALQRDSVAGKSSARSMRGAALEHSSPRPPLSLNALGGIAARRRHGRGVGLAALLLTGVPRATQIPCVRRSLSIAAVEH